MSDVSILQSRIRTSQQQANQARGVASSLQRRIAELQQEISKLERELGELSSFKGRASREGEEVRSQLADRQRLLQQIGEIEHVAMAAQLAELISQHQIADARQLLGRGLADVTSEVDDGMRKVQGRIDVLRDELRDLQNQLSHQLALAKQFDTMARGYTDELRAVQRNGS